MRRRLNFQPVDLGDAGVIERRERPCFELEARDALQIAGELIRQDFDGDVPAEPRRAPIDLAHPASANQAGDFEGPKPRPRRQCHRRSTRDIGGRVYRGVLRISQGVHALERPGIIIT